jgi:hypothetical protein
MYVGAASCMLKFMFLTNNFVLNMDRPSYVQLNMDRLF